MPIGRSKREKALARTAAIADRLPEGHPLAERIYRAHDMADVGNLSDDVAFRIGALVSGVAPDTETGAVRAIIIGPDFQLIGEKGAAASRDRTAPYRAARDEAERALVEAVKRERPDLGPWNVAQAVVERRRDDVGYQAARDRVGAMILEDRSRANIVKLFDGPVRSVYNRMTG